MSGGEQAMLSIGRGMMLKPKILIIDEPSLGLSPKLIQDTFEIIKEINNSGVTILLVEQNVEQTIKISNYCYLLSNNKIIVHGSGVDLSNNSEMRKAILEKKMNVEELTKELLRFNTINPPVMRRSVLDTSVNYMKKMILKLIIINYRIKDTV